MAGSETGDKAPRHTIADHALGADSEHIHDSDADHDHDAVEQAGLLQPGLVSDVALLSIGIDIGSSGTQVAFSRLHMQRLGEGYASRFITGTREVLYQSPVSFTPYRADDLIDARAIVDIVDTAFESAAIHPDDVHSGVVLLTGAALERANADAIAAALADRCGDIVSAAAGHHMEAVLAAFGSGAAQLSHDRKTRILNIDIGGGTTKFAIVDRGYVVATAAIPVGGRQIAWDTTGRVTRIEPWAHLHAMRAGLSIGIGDEPTPADLDALAKTMADAVICELQGPGSLPDELRLTAPLPAPLSYDAIRVSGGVGEYVYGRETRDFGDLGPALGRHLAARLATPIAADRPLLPAGECIRATVLGASNYAVQLSGRTCFIPDPALLPLRGVPVIRPHLHLNEPADAMARAIARQREVYGIGLDGDVALAIHWHGDQDYPRLANLARAVTSAMSDRIADERALIIVADADIARSLGGILKDELQIACPVLILDGIELADLDLVDVGRIRLPSETVPVTIKSLAFQYDWRQEAALRALAHAHAHASGHHHHHDDDHHDHGHGAHHRHHHH